MVKNQPAGLLGVAAAAALSLVLMLFLLADQWQGQIVEIKKGRVRKMRAMGGWQVGDHLEKRRGEAHIRVTR